MRVTLSPLTFDPLGGATLNTVPDQTWGETRRRMNRIATLDGGAVFNDFGVSEADRTIQLRWKTGSAAQEAAVQRLVQLYSRLHVSTPKGFYLAAPEVHVPGAQEIRTVAAGGRQISLTLESTTWLSQPLQPIPPMPWWPRTLHSKT